MISYLQLRSWVLAIFYSFDAKRRFFEIFSLLCAVGGRKDTTLFFQFEVECFDLFQVLSLSLMVFHYFCWTVRSWQSAPFPHPFFGKLLINHHFNKTKWTFSIIRCVQRHVIGSYYGQLPSHSCLALSVIRLKLIIRLSAATESCFRKLFFQILISWFWKLKSNLFIVFIKN